MGAVHSTSRLVVTADTHATRRGSVTRPFALVPLTVGNFSSADCVGFRALFESVIDSPWSMPSNLLRSRIEMYNALVGKRCFGHARRAHRDGPETNYCPVAVATQENGTWGYIAIIGFYDGAHDEDGNPDASGTSFFLRFCARHHRFVPLTIPALRLAARLLSELTGTSPLLPTQPQRTWPDMVHHVTLRDDKTVVRVLEAVLLFHAKRANSPRERSDGSGGSSGSDMSMTGGRTPPARRNHSPGPAAGSGPVSWDRHSDSLDDPDAPAIGCAGTSEEQFVCVFASQLAPLCADFAAGTGPIHVFESLQSMSLNTLLGFNEAELASTAHLRFVQPLRLNERGSENLPLATKTALLGPSAMSLLNTEMAAAYAQIFTRSVEREQRRSDRNSPTLSGCSAHSAAEPTTTSSSEDGGASDAVQDLIQFALE